jgi:predicted RNA polymerase sigma factor
MAGKTRRQQIEEMLAEDAGDPFLWYGLAMEQSATKDDEAALKTFAELRSRFPDYVPGYVQAGQLLARLGRDDEARAAFRLGIETARRVGDLHAAGEMEGFLEGLD